MFLSRGPVHCFSYNSSATGVEAAIAGCSVPAVFMGNFRSPASCGLMQPTGVLRVAAQPPTPPPRCTLLAQELV